MIGYKTDYEEDKRQRKAIELTESVYDTHAVNNVTGESEKVWRLQVLVPKSGLDSISERYKSQGLDVFVGDFVSDGRGGQQESKVAIFTLDPRIKKMYREIPCPDKRQVTKKPQRKAEEIPVQA